MLGGRCGLLSEIVELESETKGKAVELLGSDLAVSKGSFVAVGKKPFPGEMTKQWLEQCP